MWRDGGHLRKTFTVDLVLELDMFDLVVVSLAMCWLGCMDDTTIGVIGGVGSWCSACRASHQHKQHTVDLVHAPQEISRWIVTRWLL